METHLHVYDKTVRRRRAVLGLLVASSLILLTVYFGESAGGGLHAVQRGVLEVVSPIQEGASRALKPARDLVGWVGDTVDAKGEVKDLRAERDALRDRAVAGDAAVRENAALKDLVRLQEDADLARSEPVTSRIIGQDPSVWYSQVTINKGAEDGVRANHPVVGPGGLVGVVKDASSSSAVVTLLTDHSTAVAARVNESGVPGVVEVEAGRPTDLVLKWTTRNDKVEVGQTIVTSGTTSRTSRVPSLYPPNIPIGRVTRVDEPGTDDQEVHLRPFANMRRLELRPGPHADAQRHVILFTPQLALRLLALGVAMVILQVAAVSQIELFGTNADLSPLVVVAVGLLVGSVPGACFGFAAGLFLDLALVQTVGLSSLLFLAIGYGAGRLRELRDPQGALIPFAAGAAATAVATIGLLDHAVPARGRRACELPARARDPRHHPAQRPHLRRRLRDRAPLAAARPARGPGAAGAGARTRPAASRRCRGRSVKMIDPVTERRPPITPQLALRVAVLGVLAFALFGIVFFRLWYLQVLSGEDYLAAGARQPRARGARTGAARRDRRPQRAPLVENRVATVVQIDPEKLPVSARDAAATWGQRMTARARRPKGEKGEPEPIPEPTTAELAVRLERLGRALNMSPRTIQERIVRSLALVPYANVTVKTDVPATIRNYLLERGAAFPGVDVNKVYLRRYRQGELAAQLVGTVGEISPVELELDRFRGVARARSSARRASSAPTTATCAGATAPSGSPSTPSGGPRAQAQTRNPASGRAAAHLDRPRPAEGAGEAVMRRGRADQLTPARARRARSSRWTRATARCWRWAPTRATTRPCSPRPITERRYEELFGAGGRLAALQPRDRRPLSDGLDVQADHRAGRARQGPRHARARRSTTRAASRSARPSRSSATRARTRQRLGRAAAGAAGLLGRLLLHARARPQPAPDQPLQRWARPPRPRRADRHRRAQRGRGPRPRPLGGPRSASASSAAASGAGSPRARSSAAASPTCARGRSATTSTCPSARATCRPRRCRWPSPTRRSPTAGRVVRPHLGVAVEDANGREIQRIEPGPSRRVKMDPGAGGDHAGLAHGDDRRRHLRGRVPRLEPGVLSRSTGRPAPPSARVTATSRGTCLTCPAQRAAPDRASPSPSRTAASAPRPRRRSPA